MNTQLDQARSDLNETDIAPIFYLKAIDTLLDAGLHQEVIDSILARFDTFAPIHIELVRKLAGIERHLNPHQRELASVLLRQEGLVFPSDLVHRITIS
ncbi:hypothetical protein A2368_02075 [Candidatus Collierbacteria bacterium RIFOXYB1_FULL_49_13]|uniref:Uncharacterized protein n=1 Tax=Candidatus Collierbacteria bacterium RIFOXYB1_FULL_49_13 TaxID=1817728 RepID=A0A1F5FG85_9BACT|nr:MAG: hypothetical protein A2368_02075 [Candidatus Collierbacteria bacterium RIFOXYB1_FULL_49_13]